MVSLATAFVAASSSCRKGSSEVPLSFGFALGVWSFSTYQTRLWRLRVTAVSTESTPSVSRYWKPSDDRVSPARGR